MALLNPHRPMQLTGRVFDGTDDRIVSSIGNCVITNPATLVALMRLRADGSNHTVIALTNNTDQPQQLMYIDSVGHPCWGSATTIVGVIGISFTAADGWVLVAVGKGTGTVAARIHLYKFSTGVWQHGDTSAQANATSPGSSGKIYHGSYGTSGDHLNGEIAVTAVYASNLSDAQVETLAFSLDRWAAPLPRALWVHNQTSTDQALLDRVRNAHQTGIVGTSVGADPVPFVFNRGASGYYGR